MMKKFEDHPSAQAWIYSDEKTGEVMLVSYNTTVCGVTADGWLWCNGTYSRTTIKHIGWFMRHVAKLYGVRLSYYDAKYCYEKGMLLNVTTGEVVTIDEYNDAQNKSEAVA